MNALMFFNFSCCFQFFSNKKSFLEKKYENYDEDGNAFGDKNKIGSRGTHFHNGKMIRKKKQQK